MAHSNARFRLYVVLGEPEPRASTGPTQRCESATGTLDCKIIATAAIYFKYIQIDPGVRQQKKIRVFAKRGDFACVAPFSASW